MTATAVADEGAAVSNRRPGLVDLSDLETGFAKWLKKIKREYLKLSSTDSIGLRLTYLLNSKTWETRRRSRLGRYIRECLSGFGKSTIYFFENN